MRLFTKDTNWGAVAAVVAIVAIGVYDLAVPKPQRDPKARTVAELERERSARYDEHDKAKSVVEKLTWQGGRDEIGPKAMAWVSKAAEANFVTVNAFRPQKTSEAEGLDQLNYLVTAEGSYLNVMRLIGAIESEGSLLAVRAVQLASANGASDTVRATISLVAYQEAVTSGS